MTKLNITLFNLMTSLVHHQPYQLVATPYLIQAIVEPSYLIPALQDPGSLRHSHHV